VRGSAAIALTAAIGGLMLVPASPLAEDPPAPPTAVLETAATTVPAGAPVKLDSSKSTPGTGAIIGHVWDLDGDGSFETDTAAEPTVEVTPKDEGPLTVQVRVVDDKGLNADAHLDLTVTAPAPESGEDPADDPVKPAEPKPEPADPAPADPPHESGGTKQPSDSAPAPEPVKPAQPAAPATPPKTVHVPLGDMPALEPRRELAHRNLSSVKTVPVADVHAAASSGVTIKDFKFSPATISVSVGDTITWNNQDVAPHTATANDGSFDTGSLSKGKSGSHTFTAAGSFPYICSIHPSMKGTVTVAAASGGTSGGDDSGDDAATPSSTDDGSGLPHTGFDLLAVVLLAGLMSGTGALMRRGLRAHN